MWSDWVSNPGPLALESDMLPTVPCCPATVILSCVSVESRNQVAKLVCQSSSPGLNTWRWKCFYMQAGVHSLSLSLSHSPDITKILSKRT